MAWTGTIVPFTLVTKRSNWHS